MEKLDGEGISPWWDVVGEGMWEVAVPGGGAFEAPCEFGVEGLVAGLVCGGETGPVWDPNARMAAAEDARAAAAMSAALASSALKSIAEGLFGTLQQSCEHWLPAAHFHLHLWRQGVAR